MKKCVLSNFQKYTHWHMKLHHEKKCPCNHPHHKCISIFLTKHLIIKIFFIFLTVNSIITASMGLVKFCQIMTKPWQNLTKLTKLCIIPLLEYNTISFPHADRLHLILRIFLIVLISLKGCLYTHLISFLFWMLGYMI